MCVFIVWFKQLGLFGGSICYCFFDMFVVQVDVCFLVCWLDWGSVCLLFVF